MRKGAGIVQDDIDYAVVDVETTGLFPHHHDRVVEIAVIRVDARGAHTGELVTLINPERDVGRTDIHGITARDVLHAPRFADIAGDVVALLRGAVFVAHNASFDKRFVTAELRRIGAAVPDFPCLCTMQLSRRIDHAAPGYRLIDICKHFGISIRHAHCAYDDASATASLLVHCLRSAERRGTPQVDLVRSILSGPAECDWPSVPSAGRALRREEARVIQTEQPDYIASLLAQMPATSTGTIEVDSYLDMLDRVLADRRVTRDEAESLRALASDSGLGIADMERAHEHYLRALASFALKDGQITEQEHRDLADVAAILGISERRRNALLIEAQQPMGDQTPSSLRAPEQCDSVVGKSVCFTGTLTYLSGGEPTPRDVAEALAERHGMVVKSSVTKTLDFLVAADPDSMSGKAKKARQYGVAILAEPAFWNMLGVDASELQNR